MSANSSAPSDSVVIQMKAEIAQVRKELSNKRKRDSLLIGSAVRAFSPEACFQLDSCKLASKAKADAKAQPKAHG